MQPWPLEPPQSTSGDHARTARYWEDVRQQAAPGVFLGLPAAFSVWVMAGCARRSQTMVLCYWHSASW